MHVTGLLGTSLGLEQTALDTGRSENDRPGAALAIPSCVSIRIQCTDHAVLTPMFSDYIYGVANLVLSLSGSYTNRDEWIGMSLYMTYNAIW